VSCRASFEASLRWITSVLAGWVGFGDGGSGVGGERANTGMDEGWVVARVGESARAASKELGVFGVIGGGMVILSELIQLVKW